MDRRGGGRGRGGDRGGRGGRGGGRGGFGVGARPRTNIIPHRHPGVFVLVGKDEKLLTLNSNAKEAVYGEKLHEITQHVNGVDTKVEYREWSFFRSKLAAGVFNGLKEIYIKPGAKVLYLGAANGTTVSHVSDIVGPTGSVYAVEYSERSGRDLINMSKKRPNIVPIIDDARKPYRYRMVIPGLVDCIFADVAQPDQARIIEINAKHFLKKGGGFVFSIKANCIDSTIDAKIIVKQQVKELKSYGFDPKEILTLEPFERDHAISTGTYEPKYETED